MYGTVLHVIKDEWIIFKMYRTDFFQKCQFLIRYNNSGSGSDLAKSPGSDWIRIPNIITWYRYR